VIDIAETKIISIVPTPVGVNRKPPQGKGRGKNCPHARGGEPEPYRYA